MGNRTWCRLRDIVARLTVGDATLTALAEPYDVSVQAVAKHLEVLEAAGVASRRQEGRERPAHLEAEVLDLMTAWVERYRRRADERDRPLANCSTNSTAPAQTPRTARRSDTGPDRLAPTAASPAIRWHLGHHAGWWHFATSIHEQQDAAAVVGGDSLRDGSPVTPVGARPRGRIPVRGRRSRGRSRGPGCRFAAPQRRSGNRCWNAR